MPARRPHQIIRLVLLPILVSLSAGSGAAAAGLDGGDEVWVRRFSGPGTQFDAPCCVAVSPGGLKVFVAGSITHGTYNSDIALVAYSATTGVQLWASHYDSGEGDEHSADIAVSQDGSKVFVTGSGRGDLYPDFLTIAYDAATGAKLWVSWYDGPDGLSSEAWAVAITPDGSEVVVTGRSERGLVTRGTDYATVAYDATTGAQRWVARYDSGAQGDYAYDVASSHDGSTVFVTGASGPFSTPDYATIAYDASDGTQRWLARYDGPGADSGQSAYSLVVGLDDSEVFVTGLALTGADFDWLTIAYDAASGDAAWLRRHGGLAARSSEFEPSMTMSPDGSTVFVAGSSDEDFATVAYASASGATRWTRRYDGPGKDTDRLNGLAANPDSSAVYVTGQSKSAVGPYDFATVASDAANGSLLWVRWFGIRDRGDEAHAVAASPDGTAVYVTGDSPGEASGEDFVTIRYEA